MNAQQNTNKWMSSLLIVASITLLLLAASFAHAQGMVKVPVFKDVMRRGSIISEADIAYKVIPAHRVRESIVVNPKELIGKEVIRGISRQVPIFARGVRVPPQVRRSQPVSLVFNESGLKLRTVGTAMQDGTKGQRVKVRNERSGRIILGTVVANNLVSVN